MPRIAGKLVRCACWAGAAYLYAGLGCLPDNALREVAAENIIRTITLYTSSFVSVFFLTLFPFS